MRAVVARDPNDLAGPLGFGPARWLSGEEPLRYAVFFENKPDATAPAAEVVVTDQLDLTHVDLGSVSLGPISFAGQVVTPVAGVSPVAGIRDYQADVDLRPAKNLIVRLSASLDVGAGLLSWRFISLDPATMLPPTDPLAGFLDPGMEGSVVFTVLSKKGLPTGTLVKNQARILFDAEPAMYTLPWLNTLDNDKPVSKVLPLAATRTAPAFTVKWKGTDVGSGVRDFTVYVSDNGGPFTPWLTNFAKTSATFKGVGGHTYGFSSTARDNVSNTEAAHATADTTTRVLLAPYTLGFSPNPVPGSKPATGKVALNGPAPSGGALVTLTNTNPAATVPPDVTVPEGQSSATFPVTTSAVAAATKGTVTAKYNGASKSATLTVRPIGALSLKVSPSPVVGGNDATGTVTLEEAAGPGDIPVTLSSNSAVARPEVSSITIPQGSTSSTFTVRTSAVSAATSVTLKATANGITKSYTLSVRPVGVLSLGVSPNPVQGGAPATGTVTLSAPAGPGDVAVALSSSSAGVASVPGSVVILRGSVSATFAVTTSVVTSTKTVTLKASANGTYKTTTLTVTK